MKANMKTAYVYRVKDTGALMLCANEHDGTPVDHEYVGTAEVPESQVLDQCEFADIDDQGNKMFTTLATLFVLGFGGSAYDIVNETNYVEVPFRYVCLKTDGQWYNLHQPHAGCEGGTFNPVKPDEG